MLAVIDSSYHTYNVLVETNSINQALLNEMDPKNTVILKGWCQLPANGYINIAVKLEDILPESISIKERTQTSKDKK